MAPHGAYTSLAGVVVADFSGVASQLSGFFGCFESMNRIFQVLRVDGPPRQVTQVAPVPIQEQHASGAALHGWCPSRHKGFDGTLQISPLGQPPARA
jgi:hypothetical protein